MIHAQKFCKHREVQFINIPSHVLFKTFCLFFFNYGLYWFKVLIMNLIMFSSEPSEPSDSILPKAWSGMCGGGLQRESVLVPKLLLWFGLHCWRCAPHWWKCAQVQLLSGTALLSQTCSCITVGFERDCCEIRNWYCVRKCIISASLVLCLGWRCLSKGQSRIMWLIGSSKFDSSEFYETSDLCFLCVHILCSLSMLHRNIQKSVFQIYRDIFWIFSSGWYKVWEKFFVLYVCFFFHMSKMLMYISLLNWAKLSKA